MANTVDERIANGFLIDPEAKAETLSKEEKQRFAINSQAFTRISKIAVDGPCVLIPEAVVFGTSALLTDAQCDEWITRAKEGLETGDFIFKTGKSGFEKMPTGGRRFSSTTVIHDEEFGKAVVQKIVQDGIVPQTLPDGAIFAGARPNFLLSCYHPGQYFAPHFDGQQEIDGCVSQYTAVLYLSDKFEGGETLYLQTDATDRKDSMWSEITQNLAVRPNRGHAVVHKQGCVLHAGAEIVSGMKYIIQFSLVYRPVNGPPNDLPPLRWGV